MLKVLMIGIGVMVAGPASAGCYNYLEGETAAPRAEICFAGKCEQTAMEYECGNADTVLVGYQNGWSVAYRFNDGDETETVLDRNDRPLEDASALICRDIDAGACRFPD